MTRPIINIPRSGRGSMPGKEREMIKTEGYITSGRYGWRHGASETVVYCDHEGCEATITAKGMEYNGAEIECIYLPQPNEWRLDCPGDFCGEHAPERDDEDDSDEW